MKAFSVSTAPKSHCYSEPVRINYSFPKLISLIEEHYGKRPEQGGDLYLFLNTNRNYLKIIYWHKGGYCMFAKYLPQGTFEQIDRKTFSLPELQRLVDVVSVKRLPEPKKEAA